MSQNTLAETIRAAMTASTLSRYALSQQTGIAQPVLGRFASGERDLTLETASKLLPALGLELVTRSARRRTEPSAEQQAAAKQAKPATPKRKPAAAKAKPDILRIISEIDSGFDRGALVTFSRIRPHCGLSKKAFDTSILQLARAELVCLHRHDFPHALTSSERDQLVHSENDYFIGCARRR